MTALVGQMTDSARWRQPLQPRPSPAARLPTPPGSGSGAQPPPPGSLVASVAGQASPPPRPASSPHPRAPAQTACPLLSGPSLPLLPVTSLSPRLCVLWAEWCPQNSWAEALSLRSQNVTVLRGTASKEVTEAKRGRVGAHRGFSLLKPPGLGDFSTQSEETDILMSSLGCAQSPNYPALSYAEASAPTPGASASAPTCCSEVGSPGRVGCSRALSYCGSPQPWATRSLVLLARISGDRDAHLTGRPMQTGDQDEAGLVGLGAAGVKGPGRAATCTRRSRTAAAVRSFLTSLTSLQDLQVSEGSRRAGGLGPCFPSPAPTPRSPPSPLSASARLYTEHTG